MTINKRLVYTKYGIAGFLFGLCFPLGALLLESIINHIPIFNIFELHQSNNLIYMIDTAPIVLCLFSLLGAYYNLKSQQISLTLSLTLDEMKNTTRELEKTHIEEQLLKENLTNILNEARETIKIVENQFITIKDSLNHYSFNEKSMFNHTENLTQSFKLSLADNKILFDKSTLMYESNENFVSNLENSISNINFYIENIKRVFESILIYNDTINHLSSNIEDLSPIINSIQNINKKINILSINASIEAERAGESGRGFKVVANQVKDLSIISDSSIKDILKVTTNIQKVTSTLYNEMSIIIKKSQEDEEELDKINELLYLLKSEANDQSNVINSIKYSLNEMNSWFINSTNKIDTISNLINDSHDSLYSLNTSIKEISIQIDKLARNI